MSSHHVVRDFQEPALLIADGEMCSFALLESFLEWSPVVVALDNAFEKLVDLGVKVDYWLGDFDDLDPEEILKIRGQDHVKIVLAPDQNKTDFEKGVEFLIALKVNTIHVLWATGKRLDHSLGNISAITKYSEKVKLVFYNDYSKMFLTGVLFEKWYKKGQIISLMPLPFAKSVRSVGLKYTLENEDLEWGKRIGTSNEVLTDGLVRITIEEGHLLLIEAND